MYRVTADTPTNLLTIEFSGRFDAAEARRCHEEVGKLQAGLKPGFRLLTNMAALEVMDLACAPLIEQTMDLCNQRGVAKVVRIIPDPRKDIGLSIMSLFHYRHGIPIVTCETLAAAKAALEE